MDEVGGVGGQGCHEPSADELIEVLKDLENLAASNPQLYRAIVDQIRSERERASAHAQLKKCSSEVYIKYTI